jgi:hypothetical protein
VLEKSPRSFEDYTSILETGQTGKRRPFPFPEQARRHKNKKL